jgi:hypothetical protein
MLPIGAATGPAWLRRRSTSLQSTAGWPQDCDIPAIGRPADQCRDRRWPPTSSTSANAVENCRYDEFHKHAGRNHQPEIPPDH